MAVVCGFRAWRMIAAIVVLSLSSVSLAQFAGGTGEPNDPYQIATAEQLISIDSNPNLLDKHFILIADIDLDPNLPGGRVFQTAVIAPVPEVPGDYHSPLGSGFGGVFDGNGYSVTNMAITGGSYLGLFGWLTREARVMNLGIRGAIIVGSGDHIGGLAGLNGSSKVTRCHASGQIVGKSYVGGLVGFNQGTVTDSCNEGEVSGSNRAVGGLVGQNEGGIVTNCWSRGQVAGTAYFVGGLMGDNMRGQAANCYSTCGVTGHWYVGGLVGANMGTVIRCYSTGEVIGVKYVGGLVGREEALSYVRYSFWDVENSCQTESAGGTGLSTAEMQNMKRYQVAGWDFRDQYSDGLHEIWQIPDGGGYPVLSVFHGYVPAVLAGSGTEEDPYLIANPSELAAVRYHPDSCCKLVASIDLAGIHWSDSVIPFFSGKFDGNGHSIRNLRIAGDRHLGLFGYLGTGAEVSCLNVEDVEVYARDYYAGGIAGMSSYSTIIRCHSSGRINTPTSAGGIVGYSWHGDMMYCYSAGTISGDSYTGGIIGQNQNGNVVGCWSTATVIGNSCTGGLIGYHVSGALVNSYNGGPVSGRMNSGGLIGLNNGTVASCYNSGRVTGSKDTGGLVGGERNACVVNCLWDVESSGQSISACGTGLATTQMMDMQTFLAAGWDFRDESANGLCEVWQMPAEGGYPILSLFHDYVPPTLQGKGTAADPYLIAMAADLATVYYDPAACYRLEKSLDLSGIRWAGAPFPVFLGQFDGSGHSISNLMVVGGWYAGLFGQLRRYAQVRNVGVQDVNVTGDLYVGGLAGHNVEGAITRCFSAGRARGQQYVGGLVGCNGEAQRGNGPSGSVADCYSAVDVSGMQYVGGLVGDNQVGSLINSHSRGPVAGAEYVGGFVGRSQLNWTTIANCFWNVDTSGVWMSDGGTGLTTAPMQAAVTFIDAGWDFEAIWMICEGRDYPRLRWENVDCAEEAAESPVP